MRLSLLLLIGFLHISAKGSSQKITLKETNAPLKKVLTLIERQSGYLLFYDDNLLDGVTNITINLKDVSIQKALDESLKDANLIYRIVEKNVVIKRKDPDIPVLPVTIPREDSTIIITGLVRNEAGKPLYAATVQVRGITRGTATDQQGRFTLSRVPPKSTLIISCIGHVSEEVTVGKTGIIEVTLKEFADNLDATVVMAYGTTTKRYTTGNITSIKAADIEKQPIQNPLLALQGRVPGLIISPTSGHEHGPVSVEIRGRNAVNPMLTSDPLYIIDGVPLTVLDLGATQERQQGFNAISRGIDQSGMSSNGGQSPLFNMNPSDIESIEVLKDADATAIYGSRGANGVIIITTKKGKPGKNRFDLDFSQGVKFVTRKWDMLSTPEYLAMRREAFKNDGLTPNAIPGTPGFAPDLFLWDTTANTDWQKFSYGGTGQWSRAQGSLSGGTTQSSYRVAGGYSRTTDITTQSGANQAASFSFNISTQSMNQRFRMMLIGNYSFTDVNMIHLAGGSSITALPPNAPAVFDEEGKLNFAGWHGVRSLPFSELLRPYNSKTNLLQSNLQLSYNILRGFDARLSLGYNNTSNDQTRFTPMSSIDPTLLTRERSATFGNNKINNWIIEPQLEYNGMVFGKGRLTLLAGGTLQANRTNGSQVTGQGYTNDNLLGSISNATTLTGLEHSGQYKYAGVFARVGMRWNNRYIVNLNGRRDGSSRFGAGNQFGNFGSIGAAWILSEESWIDRLLPDAVSFLKLRSSYGITGSDAVRDYQFISQWGNLVPNLLPYHGITPLTPQIQPNPDFHWQVNRKMEAAFDLGFLRDRLTISVSYYRNRCDNQLVAFPTGDFTGFNSVVANLPADVMNSGWEGTLNAMIIDKEKFSWRADFNISTNRNKLIAYPNLEQSPYYSTYIIGQSLNLRYAFRLIGVDPATGKYMYEDYNKDGEIKEVRNIPAGTGADDRYIRLDTRPDFTGGLNNQFTFGNWQFTAFMEFTRKLGFNYLVGTPGRMSNISRYQYENRWQYPGHVSATPALTATSDLSYDRFATSDAYFTDASFIRLRTVALSYQLPQSLAKKVKMNRMAINLNAQNLFIITGYKGIDPDIPQFGSMPTVRTITAGISCSF